MSINILSQRDLLQRYVAHLEQQYAAATVQRHVASLRAYERMLRSQGQVTTAGWAEIAAPRLRPPAKSPAPKPVNLEAFLALPTPPSPKAVRDYALSAAHELEGCTVAQLRALDCHDADGEAGMLRLTGRRGKSRWVGISTVTAGWLRRWLAVRRLLGPKEEALFVALHWTAGRSEPGTRLSCRGIYDVLQQMRDVLAVPAPPATDES